MFPFLFDPLGLVLIQLPFDVFVDLPGESISGPRMTQWPGKAKWTEKATMARRINCVRKLDAHQRIPTSTKGRIKSRLVLSMKAPSVLMCKPAKPILQGQAGQERGRKALEEMAAGPEPGECSPDPRR
jgi:hypothetical protein